MTKRKGGFRRKTRYKLKKHYKAKGKISIRNYLQKFSPGDKVVLKGEPAVHEGMYFPRFHGETGEIKGTQGSCYKVQIKDGNKEKVVIVHPIHLKKV